jgi:phage-related minor tail protein
MAQKRNTDNQAAFDWEARVDEYVEKKAELLGACNEQPGAAALSADEACEVIAAAVKLGIHQAGLSREDVVDRINEYYGLGHKSQVTRHKQENSCPRPATRDPRPIEWRGEEEGS